MSWITNPFDPSNYIPKSFYQIRTAKSWQQFLHETKGKYVTRKYGTYQHALKEKRVHFESIQVCFKDNGIWTNASQRVSNPMENANLNYVICFDLNGKDVKSLGKIPVEEIINISKYLNQINQ